MQKITESDMKAMLEPMATNLPDLDPESLKDFLRGLRDCITLHASGLTWDICYKPSYQLEIWWRPQGDSNPCTHRERVMS
jgi:hypothetical protein